MRGASRAVIIAGLLAILALPSVPLGPGRIPTFAAPQTLPSDQDQVGPSHYVPDYENGIVQVIDPTINAVVDVVPMGGTSGGLAVLPDGTRLYSLNYGEWGTLAGIDPARNTVVATLRMGQRPGGAGLSGIAVHPDGPRG